MRWAVVLVLLVVGGACGGDATEADPVAAMIGAWTLPAEAESLIPTDAESLLFRDEHVSLRISSDRTFMLEVTCSLPVSIVEEWPELPPRFSRRVTGPWCGKGAYVILTEVEIEDDALIHPGPDPFGPGDVVYRAHRADDELVLEVGRADEVDAPTKGKNWKPFQRLVRLHP